MKTRRLIFKAIGRGARPQVVVDLEEPARLTQADMERGAAAFLDALGAKVGRPAPAPEEELDDGE